MGEKVSCYDVCAMNFTVLTDGSGNNVQSESDCGSQLEWWNELEQCMVWFYNKTELEWIDEQTILFGENNVLLELTPVLQVELMADKEIDCHQIYLAIAASHWAEVNLLH